MIYLKPCPKVHTSGQDKAANPADTVARVKELFAGKAQGMLQETRRVDVDRLGIPVYLSVAGPKARAILPTRKQMGKGATPAQAEASALMELVERISFFSFWQSFTNFTMAGYSEARERWSPDAVMDVSRILQSVGEDLSPQAALEILDLARWRFCRATDLGSGREERVPYGWFKMLGEFNGSSAGNTQEESILQGAAELVERHVCALIDRQRPILPTIDPATLGDPVLAEMYQKFTHRGVKVLLKNFSLDLPIPTVAALAWDPATFPGLSEIVFTAGTATSPEKAAIRALSEVAQLAGDFITGSAYEASGLPKFTNLAQTAWLEDGPTVALDSLPNIAHPDLGQELATLAQRLGDQGYALYSVDITNPSLGLPAHYSFIPGFQFRERDPHASLGLFVGRYLAEETAPDQAAKGLEVLARHYPGAFFLPFFQGMLDLRQGKPAQARGAFLDSLRLQPDAEKQGLAAFYAGYACIQGGNLQSALLHLDQAIELSPEVKEFFNQRGVALFKLERYEEAARDFDAALSLDRGSAMDLANLGLCRLKLGDEEQAVEYLRTALELDPGLEFAKNQLDELKSRK